MSFILKSVLALAFVLALVSCEEFSVNNVLFPPAFTGEWRYASQRDDRETQHILHFYNVNNRPNVVYEITERGQSVVRPFSNPNIDSATTFSAQNELGFRMTGRIQLRESAAVLLISTTNGGSTSAEFEFFKASERSSKFNRIRPQTPIGPFPYNTQQVEFTNENTRLAGVLTYPHGFVRAIAVIAHEYRLEDRDGEQYDHLYYAVMADQLTRQGIAVLRYDERPLVTGQRALASDAVVALEHARSLLGSNANAATKAGIIGFGPRGTLTALRAAEFATERVKFIALLSSPMKSELDDVLRRTYLDLDNRESKLANETVNAVLDLYRGALTIIQRAESSNADNIRALLETYLNAQTNAKPEGSEARSQFEAQRQNILNLRKDAWYRDALSTDPTELLSKLRPELSVLALWGSKQTEYPGFINKPAVDTVFIPSARSAIQKAGIRNSFLAEIPNVNNRFQYVTSINREHVIDYANIEETFNEQALRIIANWINARA